MVLVKQLRSNTLKPGKKKKCRKKWPTAGCIDSQSRSAGAVKTTQVGGQDRGYDAGKSVKGRNRFILVDTMGLMLAVQVTASSVSEKAGAQLLLAKIHATRRLMKLCGRIRLVWADGG